MDDSQATSQPQPERPGMRDYGISSAEQGMLPWSWVDERMEAARNYWVCTVRPDGRPHAAPVWGLWLDSRFYFGTSPRSVKGRNLEHNPAVVLHLESGDETVIMEGVVEQVQDASVLSRIARDYTQKYDIELDVEDANSPLFVIIPQRVFAWTEQDYPSSATRFRLDG